MAKVDFPDGAGPYFNPGVYSSKTTEKKKSKTTERSRRQPFSSFLNAAVSTEAELEAATAVPSQSEEALRELMDEIHCCGEDLKLKSVPENILAYKKAVRNFLRYVVENSYLVEERVSGANILRRKKFTLIKNVDQKLEQLAAGILAGQQDQLAVLAKIDEIAGLLVDLTR